MNTYNFTLFKSVARIAVLADKGDYVLAGRNFRRLAGQFGEKPASEALSGYTATRSLDLGPVLGSTQPHGDIVMALEMIRRGRCRLAVRRLSGAVQRRGLRKVAELLNSLGEQLGVPQGKVIHAVYGLSVAQR